jgi:hypothetical protein
MRLLYTRTAHQEAEREIEFNLDPFNQAKWLIKDDKLDLGSMEEHSDFEYIRLVTFDKAVIEELWGASKNDLMKYLAEVRTEEGNLIRSYETEITLEGHRQSIPIHLKLHSYVSVTLYAEVECYEYVDDDDFRLYDSEQHEVIII